MGPSARFFRRLEEVIASPLASVKRVCPMLAIEDLDGYAACHARAASGGQIIIADVSMSSDRL
jgi:hypothetical protein